MTASWYWLLFVLAAVLIIGVPIVERWESRADRKDAEAWERVRKGLR